MASQPPAADEDESIGERLKRLRLERGLSQRELAAPGVSYAYISRIEAGTRQPSVKALRKLAAKLGVTADYLETGAELPPGDDRELRLADLELAVRLGEAAEAEAPLEGLLAEALAAGDAAGVLRARVSLGLAARARGDFALTARLLETATEGQPFDPVHRVELYAGLGDGYAGTGRPELAVELYERCLATVEELAGAAALRTRYAALLAHAVAETGDLVRATELINAALGREEETDPLAQARLYWSLGRRARAEGRADVALDDLRRALTLLQATDDRLGAARAHLLAATLLVAAREPEDAARHLDAAERLLAATHSPPDQARLAVARAEVAVLRGDSADAVRLAREALAGPAGELSGERGAALAALAGGLALEGDQGEADLAYAQAVDLLEERRQWREAVQAARAWASMLRAGGREQAALDVLDRAAELGLRAVPGDSRSA